MRTFKNRWGDEYQAGIGTRVEFKCDVEQTGVIRHIEGTVFHIEAPGADHGGRFSGGYIGGDRTHTIDASECFVEDR